jgi:uncharacterized protein (DUF433 family)
MKPITVTSPGEVVENIRRYQKAIAQNLDIRARVAMVQSWYAVKEKQSHTWIFAPSKFIGYRDAKADRYLAAASKGGELDGRVTERVLSEWFRVPEPGSKLERELIDALRGFLAGFAKAPGARARINVLKSDVAAPPRSPVNASSLLGRISSDPAICGGRPCIKGTRMRVADIVEAVAHGASQQELLADFDYLTEEDISAALFYAARATEHRVVRTAR